MHPKVTSHKKHTRLHYFVDSKIIHDIFHLRSENKTTEVISLATKQELQAQIAQLKKELSELDHSRRSTLGKNLTFYRKQKGMTQDDLAALLDCQRPTISNIERGANGTPLDTLMKICGILEVTPNDLLLPRE